MWTGCWNARRALADVYGTVPMYNTHSPVSPQVCSTLDLYYREEIRNLKLHGEEDEAADIQQRYNDYLTRHGRPKIDLQEWPQPEVNPQPDNIEDPIWPNMGEDMDAASEDRWNHSFDHPESNGGGREFPRPMTAADRAYQSASFPVVDRWNSNRFRRRVLNLSMFAEFDSFNNLEVLDMSYNEIDNLVVPQGYRGLRKLKSLYLWGVGIRDGSKLLQSIRSFPSLNTLDLGSNNFTETVITTTQELHNFTNLEYLTLSGSSLHISLLQSIASIFPSLKNLSIFGCEVNGVVRGQGFLHFKRLDYLDMGFARFAFNTSFLHIIGESMPSLKYLSLSNSSLSTDRPFRLPIHSHKQLRLLDVSNNNFQGRIPLEIGDILPSLKVFNISMNALDSSIPSSFGNMNFLQILDLSNNQLTGEILEHLAMGCFNLQFLALSNNSLEGHMFSRNFNLTNLRWLLLEGNHFVGEIPQNLSYNRLNGSIPDLVDGLSQLSHLILAHNNLEVKNIAYTYQGRVVSYLSGLDLSCNKLIGHIPPQIGNLTRIQTLNLSHNELIRTIPSTFSNLKHIESLDLSYNQLNGKIPPQLVELNTLVVFSVAHNNLSRKIPEWTAQFATFSESSYEGNHFLCGLPLPICRSPVTMPEASTTNEENDNLIDMDNFFIIFTTSYVIVIFGIVVVLYVNPYWRRRWFYLVEMFITSCSYFVIDNLIPTRFYH
ncbi:Receptor-like protein 15 [Citrus sinensis]|nr:Receptor-like protein 15 [Citrus sinensis]